MASPFASGHWDPVQRFLMLSPEKRLCMLRGVGVSAQDLVDHLARLAPGQPLSDCHLMIVTVSWLDPATPEEIAEAEAALGEVERMTDRMMGSDEDL